MSSGLTPRQHDSAFKTSIWPTVACLITGVALYATRGVLDQTATPHGVVRFAMLPPWQALIGFVCLAGLVLVAIDQLNAPRGTTTFKRPRLGELVLPLIASVVLLFPYLPIVPDRWPALQALAGPLGAIVWLAVAALQIWVLWQSRLLTARAIERWTLTWITVAIFAATVGAASVAALRLTGTALFPAGDEPHYLVIAQSLWRDGDLKIENNHRRGDYREYYTSDLDPHYLTRGRDGEIYSIHPIGIAALLAPVYAAGGYSATVWTLILIAGVAAAIAWRWTVAVLNAPGAATFAWAAIAFSAPFLLNTFTIYPEIGAAIAVIVAVTTATRTRQAPSRLLPWLGAALAIATLPWLSTKYAPMSAALWVVAILRVRKNEPAALWRNSKVWALTGLYAVSLAAWFAFFHAYWGTVSPTAPYGSLTQTTPANLLQGGPGLLFDQEYGLLAFAPVYILAATGLWQMWRAGGELRRLAIEIACIFGALLAAVGAFGIWWGGTSSPSRPIASGLLLLMLPIAAAFRAAPVASARRAAHHLLLWLGVGIAVTLVFAQDGLLINNERDGSAALLAYWAPRWELSTLAPTFIAGSWWRSWMHAAWWLAVAAAVAVLLSRTRTTRPGVAALIAASATVSALLVIMLAQPLVAGPPQPPIDLSARARLAALDGFDSRARPASVVYDPLHKGAAVEVLPQLVLGVKAGQRVDKQPVRVIHNGRFSLPAGTYTIAVQFNDRGVTPPQQMSLQIGRNGPPMQTWTIQAAPHEQWQTVLWLPVDASFVGLRGSPELERAIASFTITPSSVIDAGARPHIPTVLSAAAYPAANLYFHNELTYPEAAGFWTGGGEDTRFTVAIPPGQREPVVLRLHPGAKENTTTISTFGWEREYTLEPGEAVDVELPTFATGVIPVTISATTGFSPRDVDPNSNDHRYLGFWVEVRKGAAPPP
ncbi:MAG TPA: hypothetical protein VEC39_16155 [Vicinamibacterales bacterium]|nr:hypothetical protein [Vicinamibacterales bacterium]